MSRTIAALLGVVALAACGDAPDAGEANTTPSASRVTITDLIERADANPAVVMDCPFVIRARLQSTQTVATGGFLLNMEDDVTTMAPYAGPGCREWVATLAIGDEADVDVMLTQTRPEWLSASIPDAGTYFLATGARVIRRRQ